MLPRPQRCEDCQASAAYDAKHVEVELTTRLPVWFIILVASSVACGSSGGSALRMLDSGETVYMSAGTMNVAFSEPSSGAVS